MTLQEYNKLIATLTHLIVLNNGGAVARALRQIGYPIRNYIPQPELETALLQLHLADPEKFFELMKSIPWNFGEAETNKPEIRAELMKLAGVKPGAASKGIITDVWGLLVGLANGYSTQNQTAPPPPPPATNTLAIVGLVVVIVVVIAATFFLIFKK